MMSSTEHLQPILTLIVTSTVVAVAYYVYGLYLRRQRDSTIALTKARRSLKIGLPITYVVALLAMGTYGWTDTVDAAITAFPLSGTILGNGGRVFVLLGAPVVASVAGYLGLFPAIKTFQDVEMTWGRVLVILVRYLAVLVALFVVLLFGASAILTVLPSFVGLIGAIVGVLVFIFVFDPYIIQVSQSTRQPTSNETDRLTEALAVLDISVVRIRVLEGTDAKQARATLRGPPGRRHLFVSDYLLESTDDERLQALLAVRAGQARLLRQEVHLCLGVGTAIAVVTPLLGVLPVSGLMAWGTALIFGLIGAGMLWVGRALVFRGDRFAAERVGDDRAGDAIMWMYKTHNVPLTWSRRQVILRMVPSPEHRLQRVKS